MLNNGDVTMGRKLMNVRKLYSKAKLVNGLNMKFMGDKYMDTYEESAKAVFDEYKASLESNTYSFEGFFDFLAKAVYSNKHKKANETKHTASVEDRMKELVSLHEQKQLKATELNNLNLNDRNKLIISHCKQGIGKDIYNQYLKYWDTAQSFYKVSDPFFKAIENVDFSNPPSSYSTLKLMVSKLYASLPKFPPFTFNEKESNNLGYPGPEKFFDIEKTLGEHKHQEHNLNHSVTLEHVNLKEEDIDSLILLLKHYLEHYIFISGQLYTDNSVVGNIRYDNSTDINELDEELSDDEQEEYENFLDTLNADFNQKHKRYEKSISYVDDYYIGKAICSPNEEIMSRMEQLAELAEHLLQKTKIK